MIKKVIKHDNYKDVLFKNKQIVHTLETIRVVSVVLRPPGPRTMTPEGEGSQQVGYPVPGV